MLSSRTLSKLTPDESSTKANGLVSRKKKTIEDQGISKEMHHLKVLSECEEHATKTTLAMTATQQQKEGLSLQKYDSLLKWSFVDAFPCLIPSSDAADKEQRISFLLTMDQIKAIHQTSGAKQENEKQNEKEKETSTSDLLLLYCQFWLCLLNRLTITNRVTSEVALWFKCDDFITDCVWYELFHKVSLLFESFETILRRQLSSFHAREECVHLIKKIQKGIGCKNEIVHHLQNKMISTPKSVQQALQMLEQQSKVIHQHVVFLSAWIQLLPLQVDADKHLRENGGCALDAPLPCTTHNEFLLAVCSCEYFLRIYTVDQESYMLTNATVFMLKRQFKQRWCEHLLTNGKFLEAYTIAKDEPCLHAFSQRLVDTCMHMILTATKEKTLSQPAASSSYSPSNTPPLIPSFTSPPFVKGESAINEPTLQWLIQGVSDITPPPTTTTI